MEMGYKTMTPKHYAAMAIMLLADVVLFLLVVYVAASILRV